MNTWFTVKVKYTKQLDDGTLKRVSEPYLLAALTFTDAEARIYEVLGETIRGEFLVTNIAKTDYADIFQYDECDKWFKVKCNYVAMDADNEKAKKISSNYLVSATDLKDSVNKLEESLEGSIMDFSIVAVAVSPIVDIFPYDEDFKGTNYETGHEDEKPVKATKGKKTFTAPGATWEDEDLDTEHAFEDEEEKVEEEGEFEEEV
jgi:Domain of unknown function (DUF4494)